MINRYFTSKYPNRKSLNFKLYYKNYFDFSVNILLLLQVEKLMKNIVLDS